MKFRNLESGILLDGELYDVTSKERAAITGEKLESHLEWVEGGILECGQELTPIEREQVRADARMILVVAGESISPDHTENLVLVEATNGERSALEFAGYMISGEEDVCLDS